MGLVKLTQKTLVYDQIAWYKNSKLIIILVIIYLQDNQWLLIPIRVLFLNFCEDKYHNLVHLVNKGIMFCISGRLLTYNLKPRNQLNKLHSINHLLYILDGTYKLYTGPNKATPLGFDYVFFVTVILNFPVYIVFIHHFYLQETLFTCDKE